jgi:predicted nucleic acid-binding protein
VRVFFDTSSFVKRFVEEVGSDEVEQVIENASEVGLSIICFTEIISALNRKLRKELISNEDYQALKADVLEDIRDVDMINLTPSVLERTTVLLESNVLRSLDAIHIACALEWGAELFVSSDERQVDAAVNAGLKVQLIEGFKANKGQA